MSPRTLVRLLACYILVLAGTCITVRNVLALASDREPTGERIVSLWRAGARVGRVVVSGAEALPACDGCVRTVEAIVDRSPLWFRNPLVLSISVVAGRDGIAAHLDGRSAYLTPLDLLSTHATTGKARFGFLRLRAGLDDVQAVLQTLASELGTDRATLVNRGRLERFCVQRQDEAAETWPRKVGPSEVTRRRLTHSVRAAASYLAKTVRPDGSFVYGIDARTGKALAGYNWPRHAGSTLFLAQAAHFLGERELVAVARRAAKRLRRHATQRCGRHRCIGRGRRVDLGSSALALLAYVELAEHGSGKGFLRHIDGLAKFLRFMQRSDGEFMHLYDRQRKRRRDVQFPFYTGEAALALARAARLNEPEANLSAASSALSHLVDKSWRSFGDRYFFGAEHWTCQALEALWEHTQSRPALRFCLDYHAFNRHVQFRHDNPLGPYDGGFGPNPFFPPRLTSASSRSEAAVATLATATRAGVDDDQRAALENQIRRSLAYVMRYQFAPGPTFLMADPAAVLGGVPGSPVDLLVRNDFSQHAGSAMIRFARFLGAKRGH
ncbi:MAG: hypothetical protein OXU20_19340 [Myxococcales bacterium]|nr:hypothetical protein [Myxococcales bacterium]MDD9971782.1 hypothetical protein [Myxococcales bacterium]